MKISILSMQRIINYGSFLQSYALKKTLEDLGHKVDFIDIQDGEYHEEPRILITSFKDKIKKYCSKDCFKLIKFRIKSKKIELIMKQEQVDVLGLSQDYITKPSPDTEAVVIGSDEVFNCDPRCSWGVSSQLFGNIDVPIVITYAASCGFIKDKDVPKYCIPNIKNSLMKLKSVSVRDENTYDFIKNISNIESSYNLDPVLIYPFDFEIKKAEKTIDINEKYMIVYAYEDRIKDKNEINAIKLYAKENGLKMYCIGGALKWCDDLLILTPFQVLAAFKHAKCIVTDTFHGTIMSAKFNKPFATFIRESNENKLSDLLKRLNLTEHRVNNPSEIKDILSMNRDFVQFNQIVESECKKTKQYLMNNLNHKD